jgi:hypothetical protein
LSKDITDLTNPEDVKSLKKLIEKFPGCDLWGSLPCDPWSKWQSVNVAQYGKAFAKKLKKRQDLSRVLLKYFFEVAELVLSQGGHIAFEWPKGAKGWLLPELVAFMKRHKLYMAECHGCFFGMQSSKADQCSSLGTSQLSPTVWQPTWINADVSMKRDSNMTMPKAVKRRKRPFTQKRCHGPSVSVFIQMQFSPCQWSQIWVT